MTHDVGLHSERISYSGNIVINFVHILLRVTIPSFVDWLKPKFKSIEISLWFLLHHLWWRAYIILITNGQAQSEKEKHKKKKKKKNRKNKKMAYIWLSEWKEPNIYLYIYLFFRKFQHITSVPDNSSLSSYQDTNQFLV